MSVDLRSPFADDDEDHRDHKHADKHDHAHHHDKDDSAHKEPEFDDEHGNHSEFHVVYQLTCTKPQAISTVDVTVFKYFPGFETVRLQWVGTNGQGMNKASQSETKVLLRP